jgi:hypothetical protein
MLAADLEFRCGTSVCSISFKVLRREVGLRSGVAAIMKYSMFQGFASAEPYWLCCAPGGSR